MQGVERWLTMWSHGLHCSDYRRSVGCEEIYLIALPIKNDTKLQGKKWLPGITGISNYQVWIWSRFFLIFLSHLMDYCWTGFLKILWGLMNILQPLLAKPLIGSTWKVYKIVTYTIRLQGKLSQLNRLYCLRINNFALRL